MTNYDKAMKILLGDFSGHTSPFAGLVTSKYAMFNKNEKEADSVIKEITMRDLDEGKIVSMLKYVDTQQAAVMIVELMIARKTLVTDNSESAIRAMWKYLNLLCDVECINRSGFANLNLN